MNTVTLHIAAEAMDAKLICSTPDTSVEYLLTDSRKLIFPQSTLFFALPGPHRHGATFIPELYARGVRNFVIQRERIPEKLQGCNWLVVKEPMKALQQLATWHRKKFSYPVLAITGSNGKTMVKEWLYHLLEEDHRIVRSPRSYNSQVGVPLSVWQMREQHTLGIFEAGISHPGEMQPLKEVLIPDIGIFTTLGEAHQEFFRDHREKGLEKMKLFQGCKQFIFCRDALLPWLDLSGSDRGLLPADCGLHGWSRHGSAELRIIREEKDIHATSITAIYNRKEISLRIPFTDLASVDNIITCWLTLLVMGMSHEVIAERVTGLKPLEMRLEMKQGLHQVSLINDSYSNDLASLRIALDFLTSQQQYHRKSIILSDILQSGMEDEVLYGEVTSLLRAHSLYRVLLVGSKSISHIRDSELPNVMIHRFDTTDDLIAHLPELQFHEETVLLKGARVYAFERILQHLEMQLHQTVMEINLSAVAHNLQEYKKLISPATRIMVMVKAFAYGSGSFEIANLLQYHGVDYLAVAYTDEGVSLRKAGIRLPVMVLNPETTTFPLLIQYGLEPEVFSFSMLTELEQFLRAEGIREFPVHVKLDTGMHRLGFSADEISELKVRLRDSEWIRVRSVFTHLVASEDPVMDDFSRKQLELFTRACEEIQQVCTHEFLRHTANSAAIARFPSSHFDMVRLGIGMYGVDPAMEGLLRLREAAILKSTIAQIKSLKKGDTVGYGRAGVLERDSTIATVRIGYADGYPRSLSKGVGKVLVNGKMASVCGNICMDMTMIDITDIPGVIEGQEVILFGVPELPVSELATMAGTIPYEILTGISQRVKRVWFEE